MKTERRPVTADFETKDGRRVSFKAVKTVMVKSVKQPKHGKRCRNCESQRRLYQRVARDEITLHNRRETILVSEIVSLQSDLDDAAWLLKIIAGRAERCGSYHDIISPADKKVIAQFESDRIARLRKFKGLNPDGSPKSDANA